jgi:hypothetical protein
MKSKKKSVKTKVKTKSKQKPRVKAKGMLSDPTGQLALKAFRAAVAAEKKKFKERHITPEDATFLRSHNKKKKPKKKTKKKLKVGDKIMILQDCPLSADPVKKGDICSVETVHSVKYHPSPVGHTNGYVPPGVYIGETYKPEPSPIEEAATEAALDELYQRTTHQDGICPDPDCKNEICRDERWLRDNAELLDNKAPQEEHKVSWVDSFMKIFGFRRTK